MTNQEKQKLNEKLARWRFPELTEGLKPRNMINPFFLVVDNGVVDTAFTDSLDACFKWLAPKLGKVGISFSPVGEQWMCDLESQNIRNAWRHTTKAETVSLAFCLAIEKLIEVME